MILVLAMVNICCALGIWRLGIGSRPILGRQEEQANGLTILRETPYLRNLAMLVIMVAFPIANACATLVGQNLGAGNLPRAWRTIFVSAGVSAALLWPAALALFLYRAPLVSLFTSDPEVAAMAVEYLGYSSVILLFYGFYFIAFRTLQAAGDMRSPMLISVACATLLGAPLGYYLATQTEVGSSGMWLANFTYAIVNCLITVAWLATGRWQRRHREAAA